MKTKDIYRAFLFLLILIFLIFIALISAFGLNMHAGNGNPSFSFSESGDFVIFMGGDVANEGNYTVRYSGTYEELFSSAGVLNAADILNNDITINLNAAVDPFKGFIICNYPGFKNQNINYAAAENLVGCGLSPQSAYRVRNYIDKNGYLADKLDLVTLGIITNEEYNIIQYKIFAYVIYNQ